MKPHLVGLLQPRPHVFKGQAFRREVELQAASRAHDHAGALHEERSHADRAEQLGRVLVRTLLLLLLLVLVLVLLLPLVQVWRLRPWRVWGNACCVGCHVADAAGRNAGSRSAKLQAVEVHYPLARLTR